MKSSKKKVVKISMSEKELKYLKSLLDSEVFKLKGIKQIVKEPNLEETLDSAEMLQEKINSKSLSL